MIPKLHNLGFFINSCLELIALLLEEVTDSFWEPNPVENDRFDVEQAVTSLFDTVEELLVCCSGKASLFELFFFWIWETKPIADDCFAVVEVVTAFSNNAKEVEDCFLVISSLSSGIESISIALEAWLPLETFIFVDEEVDDFKLVIALLKFFKDSEKSLLLFTLFELILGEEYLFTQLSTGLLGWRDVLFDLRRHS